MRAVTLYKVFLGTIFLCVYIKIRKFDLFKYVILPFQT